MLWKLTNAAGGFWDSLDHQERILVAAYGAYLVAVAVAALMRGNRQKFRESIIEELRAG